MQWIAKNLKQKMLNHTENRQHRGKIKSLDVWGIYINLDWATFSKNKLPIG
jgi:hypothetical protein